MSFNKDRFWEIVDERLTVRQKEVIHLYAEGFTKAEIVAKLDANPLTIRSGIDGSKKTYRCGAKIYGGTMKKLRRVLEDED